VFVFSILGHKEKEMIKFFVGFAALALASTSANASSPEFDRFFAEIRKERSLHKEVQALRNEVFEEEALYSIREAIIVVREVRIQQKLVRKKKGR